MPTGLINVLLGSINSKKSKPKIRDAMKINPLFFIPLVLAAFNAYPEGQQDLDGWNVRWSDTRESGSTYARIRKNEWIDDTDRMKTITIAINQNIVNEVNIGAVFVKSYASPPCSASEEMKQVTGQINSQDVRMKLKISSLENCDIYYYWYPLTNEGRTFLENAFNSGVVRFAHGDFDHIFDTRNSLPAYKLMKEMVAKEEKAFKKAL